METALDIIRQNGIIPAVVIKNPDDALPTADALWAGGLGVVEFTLRTPAGLEAIGRVSAQRPHMLVGAGTVLNVEQCRQSVAAGARFIVCPGFAHDIVAWCREKGVAVIPGCVTPTDIMAALAAGVKAVKFFPANLYGGPKALRALAGPFGGMGFIPTGGIDGQNLAQYSEMPFVHAVGGSWVCRKEDIEAGDFEKITGLCREALAAWGRQGTS